MIPNLSISKQFANKKITALCFSPDKKYCAVALKTSHSVCVYQLPQDVHLIDKWVFLLELKEQTQAICSLDWSIRNKILSCSYDRSVMVWNFNGTACNKELVYCQNKLSVLHGEWSPNGKKFAMGTSCKRAFVGYYETEQQLWSTIQIKFKEGADFQSSVTVIRFHQSGRVMAVGSADFSIKVITCYIDDPEIDAEDKAYKGTFDKITSLNEVLLTISGLQGWVNDISFTPTTNTMLILLHNNQLIVKTLLESNNKPQPDAIISWKGLPHLSSLFLSDDTFITGSFQNKLTLFKRKGNTFEFIKYLTGNLLENATAVDKSTLVGNMKNIFEKSGLKNLEKRTVSMKDTTSGAMAHNNPPKVRQFGNLICSYDSNGRILFWNAE